MKSGIFLLLLFTSFIPLPHSKANECSPHDPEGLNPDTLCIKHHLPYINNKYHVQGNGINAFHGSSIDIRYPGKKIINSPLQSDYFTSVSSGDKSNGIVIRTNKGRTFNLPTEK